MNTDLLAEREQLFSEIQMLKERLERLRPLHPSAIANGYRELKFSLTFHTNAIEGNSLDWGETRTLLMYGLTAQGKPLKDHYDIKGHQEAFLMLEEMVHDARLTRKVICELHTVLLKEPYYIDAVTPSGETVQKKIQLGQYKTAPNNVRTATGETFHFADPTEVESRMTDLFDEYNNYWDEPETETRKDPITFAAEFHYKFIIIHPFDDGNGRMARLMMNLILMRAGYPPAVIRVEEKPKYLQAFDTADQTKNLAPFVIEVAKGLKYSLEQLCQAAEGQKI